VTVRGDLDTATALQLWQYLSYLIGQGHHHTVLDLRGMILIDSAGVEVLARVSAWTRRKGGELVLRSASPDLASSWSWPAGPRPTGAILLPAAANRPADWRPDRQDHVADGRIFLQSCSSS
jgi:ABC-type transporter Mla MlaB component